MNLGDLIDLLAQQRDPHRVLARGFSKPHSYRGYYDQLAFEPARDITIESMLADARESLGKWFTGYKGGDYQMDGRTEVWLASWGNCSDEDDPMSAADVGRMLATARPPRDSIPAAKPDASDPVKALLDWLIAMDEPDNTAGMEARRTVTLTEIIRRARLAETWYGLTDHA